MRLTLPALLTSCLLLGCGDAPTEAPADAEPTPGASANPNVSGEPAVDPPPTVIATGTPNGTPPGPPADFAPLTLGGSDDNTNATPNTPTTGNAPDGTQAASNEARRDVIREALKPLQVWLGQWRGIVDKTKSYEEGAWVWDFQTNPEQPSLVMAVPMGEHFQTARMTYIPERKAFAMSLTNEDATRVFEGKFIEQVRDEPDETDKPQRTFKLELVETTPEAGGSKLVFNQQENNRYLVELYDRKPSGRVLRVDTISTQREGTSFALSDTDFGEKECIISQGLGTIAVSHKGKTYYVCCTGCKAEFEARPDYWIAKAAEKE